MPSYEELKKELSQIATLLEKLPEQVRSKAYELLVSEFLGRPIAPESTAAPAEEFTKPLKRRKVSKKENKASTEKPTKRAGRQGKESYSIDRNLNLRGDKSIPSFKAFNAEKAPDSAKEFNAVATYYLEKIAGVKSITLDMVYTCYSEAGRKPPEAFRQSFIDTKNKEGWVEFDNSGHLKVPHRGTVFVEHDLPRLKSGKKTESET